MMPETPTPPSFEESKNRRTKVRAAGLDPNYWYAVERDETVKNREIVEVKFQGQSVALYRDDTGRLHALENRCAHRAVPLTLGEVEGTRLVCQYHGWQYNGAGELVDVPHDLFGKKFPKCAIRAYPLRVRYGLVWLFFGDVEKADSVPMPEIPELEGPNAWTCVPVDFVLNAHHSMIIDNVSDFTHAYLHRKYAPFSDAKLTHLETRDDKVHLSYDTKVGRGKISGLFVDRDHVDTEAMDLCYDYPYQWSNTDNKIKHWCFVLPIDERTTRTFFLFYFDKFVVPFTKVKIPQRVMKPFLQISNKLLIEPLLSQDGVAVEGEQRGFEAHWHKPVVELNPAVNAFQALTVKMWEDHLAREQAKVEAKELTRLRRREEHAASSESVQAATAADGAE